MVHHAVDIDDFMSSKELQQSQSTKVDLIGTDHQSLHIGKQVAFSEVWNDIRPLPKCEVHSFATNRVSVQ